ncbi:MAG: hypothetical protein Q8S33_29880 [Myxococcales bacterium]|nr:hypothetical protein [Myxococcales bacterium]
MRTCLLTLTSFTLLACTPGNGPIFVSSVKGNTLATSMMAASTCVPTSGDVTSLFVDAAAGPDAEVLAVLAGYIQYFGTKQPLVVGLANPTIVAPVGLERFVVQRVLLRYASRPTIPGLTASVTDTVTLTRVITSTTPVDITVSVPLFGPNARDRIAALSGSNTDPPYQFTSTFELQGVIEPSGAEFKTQPFPMPITLVKSEVICSTAQDQRLKRFRNAAIATRACFSSSLGRRLDSSDCCLKVDMNGTPEIDANEPGCDVLP